MKWKHFQLLVFLSRAEPGDEKASEVEDILDPGQMRGALGQSPTNDGRWDLPKSQIIRHMYKIQNIEEPNKNYKIQNTQHWAGANEGRCWT